MTNEAEFQKQFQQGKTLFEAGNFKEAARHFIPLMEAYPDNSELRRYLTQSYAAFGYFAEAVETFRPVFEQMPDAPAKYGYFGNLCFLAGMAKEALTHLEKARLLAPQNPEIPSVMALCHVQLGDMKAANASIREALKTDPQNIRALVILADIDPGALSAENKALLHQVVGDKSQHPGNRIDTAFALGKAYLRAKNYDHAFPTIEAGNTLLAEMFQAQGAVYDPAGEERQYQDIANFYTDAVQGPVMLGNTGALVPIFIIGLPRSGTTLVEQILASHPNVYGAGEYKLLGEFYLRLEQLAKENPTIQKQDILAQVMNSWVAEYYQKMNLMQTQGVTHTTDKMPLNFPYAGLAAALFPEARFVFLRRHPLDNCLAMYFQPLTDSYPASTSLKDLGAYYKLFERYLALWNERLPGRFLEVSYEDLVADQEGVSKKLVAFAGLEWDEVCLEFHKNPRSVQTMSNMQVRKPISAESVGRWKHFEAQLGPLKEALEGSLPDE